MKIIEAIRAELKRTRTTQRQLARMIHVSDSTMSEHMNGTRRLTLDRTAKIAKALGMTTSRLVELAEDIAFEDEWAGHLETGCRLAASFENGPPLA